MYDLLNMNVDYLKHRIKVLECLKYKTDAKNMENFSVRFLLKIIMYKCIHKFFCVI